MVNKKISYIHIILIISLIFNFYLYTSNQNLKSYKQELFKISVLDNIRTLDSNMNNINSSITYFKNEDFTIKDFETFADMLDFLIFEFHDIEMIFEIDELEDKKTLLTNDGDSYKLLVLKKNLEKTIYDEIANSSIKTIKYKDLSYEFKTSIDELEVITNNYFDYRDKKYGWKAQNYEFINEFNLNDDDWIYFFDDVVKILYQN
ncbi:MAG: hypothetical protein N4A54_07620 [Peptostreptococcaceae bacterium]|nr:hypothetical protein [Peptostreptococcaceae bacterium]